MRLVAGQGCGDRPHRLVGRAGRRKSTKEPGGERGSDDRIEPKLPPAACRAFQIATIFCASATALRSASARLASSAARAAARSRSCAQRF
jgi:hypothetical protein